MLSVFLTIIVKNYSFFLLWHFKDIPQSFRTKTEYVVANWILKSWVHVSCFYVKWLLAKSFQERRLRTGKRVGFCLHHIQTSRSDNQPHQATGQFCETMLQLEDHPWRSWAASSANTNNSPSQSVHPTQRAEHGAVTHRSFRNDPDGDCFHPVIEPLEIWISDWWTLSRCKGHAGAFKWNVTLPPALCHNPREMVSVFFRSSEKAWELNPPLTPFLEMPFRSCRREYNCRQLSHPGSGSCTGSGQAQLWVSMLCFTLEGCSTIECQWIAGLIANQTTRTVMERWWTKKQYLETRI